jgi:hypothetical protein
MGCPMETRRGPDGMPNGGLDEVPDGGQTGFQTWCPTGARRGARRGAR